MGKRKIPSERDDAVRPVQAENEKEIQVALGNIRNTGYASNLLARIIPDMIYGRVTPKVANATGRAIWEDDR